MPYSQVRRRVWTDHRPTAQTLDPHGYSTPRAHDGFAYSDCGISPNRLTCGLILRTGQDSGYVLAVGTRQFRAGFLDTGQSNNCIHADPLVGNLPAGKTAEIRTAAYLMEGSLRQVAETVAQAEGIPLYDPDCWTK